MEKTVNETPQVEVVGKQSYPAERVRHGKGLVLSVKRSGYYDKWLDDHRNDVNDNGEIKEHPEFKIGFTIDNNSAWGYNKHEEKVVNDNTVWLSEWELRHAFACNAIISDIYWDDIMETNDWSSLVGCYIEFTQVMVLAGEPCPTPYGYSLIKLNQHDDVTNLLDSIKMMPYAGPKGLHQAEVVNAYAEAKVAKGHYADDILATLISSDAIIVDDAAKKSVLRDFNDIYTASLNKIAPKDMLEIIKYSKEMATLGVDDIDIITSSLDSLDIPNLTDTQMSVVRAAIIKAVGA